MVANAVLPILVLVALGLVIGDLPAAIRQGMSSAGGHRLELALAFTCVAYLANLLLGPYQDILTLVVRTRLNDDLQARLMAAVSEPTGVAHLEDPELLDKLAWARGELLNVQPSDAPVTLALVLGNMLTGIIACAVLGAFRWWLGLAMLAIWLFVRVPLQATMRGQVAQYRGGTDVFRRAYYFLGTALGAGAAKELRVFGLSDWIVGEYRQYWSKAARLSHQGRKRFIRTYLGLFVPVLLAYVGGSAAVAWAGYHHEIGLGEMAVMLVMLVATSQVGSLGRNELVLQQMVTALPDVDELVREMQDRTAALAGTRPAVGLPEQEVRFERVSFRYPRSDQDVLDGLELVVPTGRSTAIVGLNGAGKTTLVSGGRAERRRGLGGVRLRRGLPGAYPRPEHRRWHFGRQTAALRDVIREPAESEQCRGTRVRRRHAGPPCGACRRPDPRQRSNGPGQLVQRPAI
jgi:ATP-binding cassette subfamily B protein